MQSDTDSMSLRLDDKAHTSGTHVIASRISHVVDIVELHRRGHLQADQMRVVYKAATRRDGRLDDLQAGRERLVVLLQPVEYLQPVRHESARQQVDRAQASRHPALVSELGPPRVGELGVGRVAARQMRYTLETARGDRREVVLGASVG